jgi:hypothetical protein
MTNAKAAVRTATDNRWFEHAARAGFAASGVLHLLLAWIIVRLAFGDAGNADQSGALATLAGQTGGAAMLWLAAAGLAALGLWHAAEAVVTDDLKDRVKAGAVCVVNLALALSAVRFATGAGQSSGGQNAGTSAQLMHSGWGKAVLVAVAIGLIAVGGYHVYKGATRGFEEELERSCGPVVTWVGVVGYVAKGLALAGTGILVGVATFTADPAKASGVDAAIKTLGAAPFGRVLLVLAALGIAAYGAYGFVRARHGEM